MVFSGRRAPVGIGASGRRRSRMAAVLIGVVVALLPAAATAAPPRMKPAIPARIATYRLFDIGVADVDRNGWQDLFTTNHKFESSFLTGHGGRRFTNAVPRLRLEQDEQFPGLGRLRSKQHRTRPGIYVWPTDRPGEPAELHITSTGLAAAATIKFMTMRIRIGEHHAASTTTDTVNGHPVLDFEIDPGGDITVVAPGLGDLPVRFEFAGDGERAVVPSQIKVGSKAVSPSDLGFEFNLHDRHGIAFADVGGDSDQDAFVVTGGHGGDIADRYRGMIEDQLMVSGVGPRGEYGNRIGATGIRKGPCRGRSVAWVDYDDDGLLDLFTSCEGARPRLYRQVAPLRFEHDRLPNVVAGAYRWIDLDRGRPELLASTRRGLEVWRSHGRRWHRSQTVRAGRSGVQIAVGDQDRSGSIDVLVTADRLGTHLLINRRGRLHVRSAGHLGLPTDRVGAASFVDYDNDGWLDVDFAPQGLYRWSAKAHRYMRTGALELGDLGYAIVEWMDYDNDGRRDPLIATANREFSRRSKLTRRRNVTRAGHWLEVDLRGPVGNREAIGAEVEVSLRGRRSITQWVGQNDDSRHSQGHYRLYFGLGESRIARRLEVRWPDGHRTRLRHVRANRLLRISRD